MIRKVTASDFCSVLEVINDAAQCYKGVIPGDRWKNPYMPLDELDIEIKDGVKFYGFWESGKLVGVMGIQRVFAVTLIRHAYVLPEYQRRGIGKRLLYYLLNLAETQVVLVGTWASASWAVEFYEKNGFKLTSVEEKDRLLRRYWKIPDRQVETSVVLKLER
jgi:GNAT superfamily N-acetyltransferase